MSACTKEGGCVLGLDVVVKHGTESCGDRIKDVEPVRKTRVEAVDGADKS